MADPLPLEVDVVSVKNLLDTAPQFLLVDCREQDEWDLVHIDAAKLLPMSQIQDRLAELTPHQARRIVVHCHHGGRSLRVAQWLRSQGYSQAQSMAGGIDAWSEQIDPALPRY